MQANHEPIIDVTDISGEDSTISLTLSNRGNGPAGGLLTQLVVYKQSEEVNDEAVEVQPGYRGEGSIIGPNWTHLWRGSEYDGFIGEDRPEGPLDGIEADESSVEFTSDISLTYMSPGAGGYDVTFSEMMQRIIKEWECEYIAIDIHIAYTTIAQNYHVISPGSIGNIPVDEDLTLQEALEGTQIGAPLGDPVSEEEVASMIKMEDIDFS